jgi:hypothetical protein
MSSKYNICFASSEWGMCSPVLLNGLYSALFNEHGASTGSLSTVCLEVSKKLYLL